MLRPQLIDRMTLFGIHIGAPQRIAAVLLSLFFFQCLWVVDHQDLTARDYRFARCGREMWERPSPLAGYFTTCGNMQDGTLAYRAAGLPLTVQRLVLLAADHFRKPDDRIFAGKGMATTWEMRHQLTYVLLLMRLPFIFFAIWLGGGLWWVSRRLFGNEGGALSLALYCFSPDVIRSCLAPNNEVLAMWGIYGIVYTAIGVAHAMQGPRSKWRPRIAILTVAFGLTAAAHVLAAVLGLIFAFFFMMYLAERRRGDVFQILTITTFGAMLILFASYGFRPSAFYYVFAGSEARIWFSLDGVRHLATSLTSAGITIAISVALLLYVSIRRCRYFGNTTPLLVALILLPILATGEQSEPWLWALPFLFTFVGGVFSDVLQSRRRKLFLVLGGAIVLAQAGLCVAGLPLLLR